MKIIKSVFDEGWIDVYDNEGKKGGVYFWGSYDLYFYILMSYKNDFNFLFILIYELGYFVYSYYLRIS